MLRSLNPWLSFLCRLVSVAKQLRLGCSSLTVHLSSNQNIVFMQVENSSSSSLVISMNSEGKIEWNDDNSSQEATPKLDDIPLPVPVVSPSSIPLPVPPVQTATGNSVVMSSMHLLLTYSYCFVLLRYGVMVASGESVQYCHSGTKLFYG